MSALDRSLIISLLLVGELVTMTWRRKLTVFSFVGHKQSLVAVQPEVRKKTKTTTKRKNLSGINSRAVFFSRVEI